MSQYYAFPEYSIGRYAFLYNTTTNEVEPIVMTVSRYQQLDGPFWNHTFLNPDHKIDDEDFDGDFDIVTSTFMNFNVIFYRQRFLTPRVL